MIKEIFNTFSPSGNEELIRELLMQQLHGVFERIETDNIGNLIAVSGNGGLCIECGMDSTGIMVVSKTDTRVYFASVGAIKPTELADKKIVFGNGSTGVVKYDEELDLKSAKISDLYIEMDTSNMNIGDFGAVVPEFDEDECSFSGYGLKNRIGLAVVCSALKSVGEVKDTTVLFSAQKRLGGRGIRAFFGEHRFDRVITVDGCGDGGCLIIAKDARAVASYNVRSELEKIVLENELGAETAVSDENFFIEQILVSGGTACGAVGVSVLCDNNEPQRVNKTDFSAAVKLLTAVLKKGGNNVCL